MQKKVWTVFFKLWLVYCTSNNTSNAHAYFTLHDSGLKEGNYGLK